MPTVPDATLPAPAQPNIGWFSGEESAMDIVRNCGRQLGWLLIPVGFILAIMGGFLTATVVGGIVGIPLLLVAAGMMGAPRLRPCT
jgi:hypothetical protein